MTDTTITHHGHACVRLERAGRRLVLDPGSFSDLTVLDDAEAVLVTHEHVDHVDVARLAAALAGRHGLAAWAPADVVAQLVEAGAPAARVRAVVAGDVFEAAGFEVRAVGEQHALIHPDVPRPRNVGYLVDGGLLHPGDAFTEPPAGTRVEVLLVPVAAPWLKLAEAIDYVRAVHPRVAAPIHDAILSEPGRALADRLVGGLGGAGEYVRIAAGSPYTWTPAA
ncbi:MBL fold metallo-hydrolase [Cellulomonas pakistanensis]|uniref:MBL fold metallo-hydrolase n=1 Tax=Cellulomonas pakistanensis TaxID=992287 RepID=A0A919PAC3_9CELL|nr:MBL fold metallo-hydrolase [Cellulomonas pakistanensis]GIG34972.1 MBL fold metallo-hydrolase [Cellulomonas pakistanensis]